MADPKKFGQNLKHILDELDFSQDELAKRAHLTPAAISQIINGQREPSLNTICKILGVIPVSFERLVR